MNARERESIHQFLKASADQPIDTQLLIKAFRYYQPTTYEFRSALKEASVRFSKKQRQSLTDAVAHLAGARGKTDELTAGAVAMARRYLDTNED